MLDFLNNYKDRVKDSKSRIENCYRGKQSTGIPLVFNLSPYYLLKNNEFALKNYFSNPYAALEIQLKSINEHLEVIEDDYIPYLYPYWGVCALASGFGGKIQFYENKDPWLDEKVIKNFKDIDKLKKPEPEQAGLMKTVFSLMKIWKKEVKDGIPIGITDIQGPISISIDLMGVENFFLGIIDCPNKIHKLLDIVTEYLINCLKKSYSIIGDRDDGYFVTGIYIPAGYGKVRISEDNIIFISPEICKEFLRPYIERIFYEIGNGSVHWCGDGFKNINEISKIKGLTGINNCSMGDIEIIKKQNEISIERNLIYHNEVIMPKPEWFVKLKEVLIKKCLLHHFVISSDNFGISFNGYELMDLDNKIDYIKNLTSINHY